MNDKYEFDMTVCLTNFIGAIVKVTEDANGIDKKCICIPIDDNMINVSKDGSAFVGARVYRRDYETRKGATHRIKTDLIAWKAKKILSMGFKIPEIGSLYRPWTLLNAYREAAHKYDSKK